MRRCSSSPVHAITGGLAAPVTDEWEEVYRANALFDAHQDDPEFGDRFLVGESETAGQVMCERTAWRIYRDKRW